MGIFPKFFRFSFWWLPTCLWLVHNFLFIFFSNKNFLNYPRGMVKPIWEFSQNFPFCLVIHSLTQLSEVSGLTNRKKRTYRARLPSLKNVYYLLPPSPILSNAFKFLLFPNKACIRYLINPLYLSSLVWSNILLIFLWMK